MGGGGKREQHLLPASSHLPGWWEQIFAIGKVLKASNLEAPGVKVRGEKAGSWAGQMSRRGKGQNVPAKVQRLNPPDHLPLLSCPPTTPEDNGTAHAMGGDTRVGTGGNRFLSQGSFGRSRGLGVG